MTCKTFTTNGVTAIVCSRGQRPIRCKCGARGDKLCDYPIEGKGTCDAPMCDRHTTSVAPGIDYCLKHMEMHNAAKA